MKKIAINLFAIVLILFTASSLAAQPTTQAAAVPGNGTQLTVAILDFDANVPGSSDLGKQISETLTATLSGEIGFTLVDRSMLGTVLKEHALSLTGLVDADTAMKIGKLVGARILVTGKAFSVDKSIFLTAKLIGTETGLVDGIIVKGQQGDDLGDLIAKLSLKVADRLHTGGAKLLPADEPVDPLPALKARLAGQKLPTLELMIHEEHEGLAQTVDPAVDTELRKMLTDCGFSVIDAAEINPAKANVRFIIKGEGVSEYAGRLGNLQVCSARLELNVVSYQDGKTVFADRITTRGVDLSENIAGKTALQKAGHELGIRLIQHFAERPTSAPSP
jgi:TolB-like protein